jgi:hypothetical protein
MKVEIIRVRISGWVVRRSADNMKKVWLYLVEGLPFWAVDQSDAYVFNRLSEAEAFAAKL